MSEHDEQDLSKLEHLLAGLRPSAAGLDRDRLMFQAGQTARSPRRLLWPAATCLAAAVAVCLGLVVLLRPEPAATVQVVYVDREIRVQVPSQPESPAPLPPPEREGPASPAAAANLAYWQLHELAVRHGIEALPEPVAPVAAGPTFVSPATSVGEWRSRPGLASSLFNAGVE